MAGSKSILTRDQLQRALTESEGALALAALNDLEEQLPHAGFAQIIEEALGRITDDVLRFHARKTARLLTLRLAAAPLSTSEEISQLLNNPEHYEELALKISNLGMSEAILASDVIRAVAWQEFSPPVLPTICRHFKRFGSIVDVPPLLELCRHPHPMVLTSGLEAIETIDPVNLQGLVLPLLENLNSAIRGQAIRALYRIDKPLAIQHWTKMLFSKNTTERELALVHSGAFPFREIESSLLRFAAEVSDPKLLVRLSQIMQHHATIELPFKLYWICRSLRGQHLQFVKGILLGVVRTLSNNKVVTVSPDDFLTQLKARIRKEEERLLSETLSFSEGSGSSPLPAAFSELGGIAEVPSSAPAAPPKEAQKSVAGTPSKNVPSVAGTSHRGDAFLERMLEEIEKKHDALLTKRKDSASSEAPEQPAKKTGCSLNEFLDSSPEKRIEFLSQFRESDCEYLRPELPKLMKASKPREKVAYIKMLARLRDSDHAHLIKPYLNSGTSETACAAIDALAILDFEYLAIYLPKIIQHPNGRIRRHAVQAFAGIDQKQLRNLIGSIFRSNDPRERAMAIGPCMMVDFSLIRPVILQAFSTENISDNLEKIGLLLIANPDRELFHQVFTSAKRSSHAPEGEIKRNIIIKMAEKLAIALGKTETPEALLEAEERHFATEKAFAAVKAREPKPQKNLSPSIPKTLEESPSALSIQSWIRVGQSFSLPIYVWGLIAISWAAMMADLIYEYWTD